MTDVKQEEGVMDVVHAARDINLKTPVGRKIKEMLVNAQTVAAVNDIVRSY
jgi:hypothetical protein